jgi:hypothetical protein
VWARNPRGEVAEPGRVLVIVQGVTSLLVGHLGGRLPRPSVGGGDLVYQLGGGSWTQICGVGETARCDRLRCRWFISAADKLKGACGRNERTNEPWCR